MTRRPRDIAASVRSRLFQRSRERGEDFQLTLKRYVVQGLLCRLGQSAHRGRFILKGAMLYVAWGEEAYRPTRDLDLLGFGPAGVEPVAACFRDLCAVNVAADGLVFLADSVRAEKIREVGEYGGTRVRLEARLAEIRLDLQVDVGFGDVVVPHPEEVDFPALLEGPGPRIRAYSRESVVAEKLHAAVLLGDVNSRTKDFYDLTLTQAIAATFERRRMPLPMSLPIRPAFFDQDARAGQWRAYLDRARLDTAPRDFAAVGEAIREFLGQPYGALVAGIAFNSSWVAGGPWR
jgi:hypothetical protein